MTDSKLSLIWDRNDVYPWPWVFADEILTKEIIVLSKNKKLSLVIHKYDNGHIYNYANEEELSELTKDIFKKIATKPDYYKKIVAKVYDLCENFLSFSRLLAYKNPKLLSNSQLINGISSYVKELKKIRLYGWVPALIDGISEPFMSNACLEALRREFPKAASSDINRYYSVLTVPEKYSQVQQSEIEKYQLALRLGQDNLKRITDKNFNQAINNFSKILRQKINSYLKRYAWITYNFEGPALTLEILAKSLKGLTVNKAKKELALIKVNHNKNLKIKKSLQKTLKLNFNTCHLLKMASDFLLLKEYRKSIYQKSYIDIDPYLTELAKRLKLTLREIKFLHPAEFNSAITSPGLYKRIAKFRSKYCLISIKNGLARYYFGQEAKKIEKQFIPKFIQHLSQHQYWCWKGAGFNKKDIGELKGLIAFAGQVKGIVKVIHTTEDMVKMRQGDVLVSGSTNPDLLPAMKKAAAFVTDIGGITSHAAIVARELRIPCVVGAKIATKVLKDGDKVNVDANHGIVKKI